MELAAAPDVDVFIVIRIVFDGTGLQFAALMRVFGDNAALWVAAEIDLQKIEKSASGLPQFGRAAPSVGHMEIHGKTPPNKRDNSTKTDGKQLGKTVRN